MLRIASLAAVCVAGMAGAAPEGIAGRWVSAEKRLTLDITRCPTGWCGVVVTDGACGRTVLRLEVGKPDETFLKGSLQLTPDSLSYWVRAGLRRNEGAPVLAIVGNTGRDEYALMRRTFDFRAELVRMDQPACTPDHKVS